MMLTFATDKLQQQWGLCPVALRLVVEHFDQQHDGVTRVFRIKDRKNFEGGAHHQMLSVDVVLVGVTMEELQDSCLRTNERFPVPGHYVCQPVIEPTNAPGGYRVECHVHIEVPLDWKNNPRSFLRDYGYLQSEPT